MTAPYLHVGLYDADREGAALREAARVYLLMAGADVEAVGPSLAVGAGTPLTGDRRSAAVEVLPAAEGGLLDVVVELGDLELEPPPAWRGMLTAALDLVAGVRPVLATLSVEDEPDALPDPTWLEAATLLGAGWVDLARCSTVQRLRFEELAQQGVLATYEDGLAWGLDHVVRPDEPSPVANAAPYAVAAAVYEAWTGRAAEEVPVMPPLPAEDDPAAPRPQVWWWVQDEDPETLRERAAAAAPDDVKPYVGPGDPGWQAVVAELAPGQAAAALDVLRATVPEVRPSWAAVQPAGGLAVPGMDPELPMTGVLVNPWVSYAWAGDALPALEEIFAGAHREELADGVLWVTDPRLADVPDPSWADDDVRWDRLVTAADVLGRAARRGE